jgi:hypothetical protein
MGIDVLNLIKSMQEQEEQMQKQVAMQKDLEMTKQTAALAGTPLMDPTKNPQALEMINGQGIPQPPQAGQEPPGQQPPLA